MRRLAARQRGSSSCRPLDGLLASAMLAGTAALLLTCTVRALSGKLAAPLAPQLPRDAAPNGRDGDFRTAFLHVGANARAALLGSPADNDYPGWWHSQYGQDFVISSLFHGQPGFFVELASNRPIYISNTRALERDFGWKGLCIDGNDALLLDLARRRQCTVVGSLVSSRRRESMTFAQGSDLGMSRVGVEVREV